MARAFVFVVQLLSVSARLRSLAIVGHLDSLIDRLLLFKKLERSLSIGLAYLSNVCNQIILLVRITDDQALRGLGVVDGGEVLMLMP